MAEALAAPNPRPADRQPSARSRLKSTFFTADFIVTKAFLGHPLRGKALLEMRAYLAPVEFAEPPDGAGGFCFPIHDKAGYTVIDDFRHRARAERDNRRAARHGFDHDQAERLRPVDRKQQSCGIGEKLLLGSIINFANQPDLVAVDLRFKPFLEVTPLTTRYFRRDAKRHSRGARNADCGLRALLGGESAEKRKIGSAFEAGVEQIGGQAVIYGAEPVRLAKRGALIVRNRNEGSGGETAYNILQ